MNFQMFKLVLEKAEEPEIKLPTSAGSWKKQESSRKASISALLTMSQGRKGQKNERKEDPSHTDIPFVIKENNTNK